MKQLILLITLLIAATPALAARSVIVEAEGSACAAKGAVTEKTEQQALDAALKKAHAIAAGHVVREAGLIDPDAAKELTSLYSEAPIRGLQELKSEKYKNGSGRRCVAVKVRAEVLPDEKGQAQLQHLMGESSRSPLNVKVWPERPVYRQGETITFFVKGNKPFYGSIVYTDASDNIVQIIPSKYHPDPSFEADKQYQLPGEGEFTIRVAPPAFGTEKITVYAATVPLDRLAEIVPTGTVEGAFGGKFSASKGHKQGVVEYAEVVATLTTVAEK